MNTMGARTAQYEKLKVSIAAQKLGISERKVRRLLQQGKLKGEKIVSPRGPHWIVFLEREVVLLPEQSSLVSPCVESKLNDIASLSLTLSSAGEHLCKHRETANIGEETKDVLTEPINNFVDMVRGLLSMLVFRFAFLKRS